MYISNMFKFEVQDSFVSFHLSPLNEGKAEQCQVNINGLFYAGCQ